MDLTVHIKDLLFKYNCVIVPGFGAFVLNYAPSEINTVSNTFTPPSKEIVFNTSINRNDGLLADYISSKINATFEEAALILKDSVEDLKVSLNKGKKIYFKDIGYFTINKEGSYQFESDGKVNFYLESFGLTALHSPVISREGISRRIEKKIKEIDIEHKDRRSITTTGWVAAASLLLIAVMSWAVLKTEVIKNVNESYAGIFNTLVTRIYNNDLEKSVSKAPTVVSVPKTNINRLPASSLQSPASNTQPEVLSLKEDKYYIIGGCFSIEDNAKKFVEELKSKGYEPVIIGKTKTGLIRVSYGLYQNAEQANKELSSIHTSQNPGAWLLRDQSTKIKVESSNF